MSEVQGGRRHLRHRRRPAGVSEGDRAGCTARSRSGHPGCTRPGAPRSSSANTDPDPAGRVDGHPPAAGRSRHVVAAFAGGSTTSRRSSPRRRSSSSSWRSAGACSRATSPRSLRRGRARSPTIGFAWVVFFGAGACIKYRLHPCDRHADGLAAAAAAHARWRGSITRWCSRFCAFMVWFGIRFAIDAWDNPTSVLRSPLTMLYGPVAVGFALMIVRYIQYVLRRRAGSGHRLARGLAPGDPDVRAVRASTCRSPSRSRSARCPSSCSTARSRSTSSCRRW